MFKYLLFILLLISIKGKTQSNSSSDRNLYLHVEAFGNGYYYSIGIENYVKKGKLHTGDRIGVSYFPFKIDPHKNLSLFYEKNLILGHGKLNTELGLGATCICFYKGRPVYYYYYGNIPDDKYYFEFMLTTRLGLRYSPNKKMNIRVAFLPTLQIHNIDNSLIDGLGGTFGVSIGYKLK